MCKAISFCDQSVRLSARVIYGIAVGILIAPIGIAYHSAKTFQHGVFPKKHGGDTELALDHLQALIRDIGYFVLTLGGFAAPYAYGFLPEEVTAILHPSDEQENLEESLFNRKYPIDNTVQS